jgi:extracellular factor (EF) 3-hydroxypalmitic acid methyl ester biosynthesis protein
MLNISSLEEWSEAAGNQDIRRDFYDTFSEFERKHVELQERLNSWPETGDDLEKRLSLELPDFTSWRSAYMDELGRISDTLSQEAKEIHIQHARQSKYYRIVQEAPFYWQIINRPNGYPGDADMMGFIYRNRMEGNTPFGMLVHKDATMTKACQSVRNRKDYLTEKIIERGSARIMSLAAGPGQEISEILSTASNGNYQFLALDHDMYTIDKYGKTSDSRFRYALANAFQIIAGNYMIAYPYEWCREYCSPQNDFKGWRRLFVTLKYNLSLLKENEFDVIYSAGLYDYIKTYLIDHSKGTIALTRKLFNLIKPGGSLILGNFTKNNPRDVRFGMEYVYDWHLIYRDKQDMLDFARDIPEKEISDIQIVEEPLGINQFLKIEKR